MLSMNSFAVRSLLVGLLFGLPLPLSIGAPQKQDDLNRIIRVKPGPAASRVGTAVHWETKWDDALAKAQASGKPIFWYVPTVPGSFMDRVIEIDRYMLAGPFSWTPIIRRLNQDYVPLRVVPTDALIKQFDLVPYRFVEPGFLVIATDQSVRLRVDHLTTLHPHWLERLIASPLGVGGDDGEVDSELARAWLALDSDSPKALPVPEKGDRDAAEKLLLAGMIAFRQGDHGKAKALWRQAAAAQPDSPSAWKAAAEAEGFGPFVRGFEVFSPLPESAWRAGIDSVGSAAPPDSYTESELWDRGVRFLLGMQAADGGFVDSDYDFGGFDSLANVHCAVTSLVGLALVESLDRVSPDQQGRIRSAIDRAAAYVSDESHLNLKDKDEILWAQAYRVRFLARLVEKQPGKSAKLAEALDRAIDGLEQIQLPTGGWYHEYANPFVTATALTALHFAQQAKGSVDRQKIDRGLARLRGERSDEGAYPYASSDDDEPGGAVSIPASAGRIPVCELALWLWGRLDDRQLERAARVSLEHHDKLQAAYKYDNHTSTLAYGGFFFWYDMHARAELIARLPDDAVRRELSAAQRRLITSLPEIDGCFVDSHELGRCYGTAMALLSLAELQ
jgi:hypothetical protein